MTKIILDACNNHIGSERIRDTMIEQAASNRIEYIKFQLFNSEKLNKNYPNYSVYKAMCKECEIDLPTISHILRDFKWSYTKPMFTIFSEDRLDLLDKAFHYVGHYNIEPSEIALKLGSPDMSNYSLIEKCLEEFPNSLLVISTGMHSPIEIVDCISKYGSYGRVKFLHCISEYPTDPKDVDFNKIVDMDGFSDHTLGIEIAKKVIALNSEFLEFHYTLSRNLPGKDQIVSKDLDDVKRIVRFRQSIEDAKKYKTRWCANDYKTITDSRY